MACGAPVIQSGIARSWSAGYNVRINTGNGGQDNLTRRDSVPHQHPSARY